MLPYWLDIKIRQLTGKLVSKTLSRTALSANELTLLSFVLNLGAVWLLAAGVFFWAGCLILFASCFDMLDGALARAKNEESRFGSFLDSTLDRYSESLIFFGLLLYYHQVAPKSQEILLIYAAITGSLLVSYVRARAESKNFDCKVGVLERPERIIIITFGLITNWMYIVLWILAILTHVTAIQRFIYVWWQSRRDKEHQVISSAKNARRVSVKK
jgi:CDP-diacylglycerol--glycerol-3-phosphate 3-phosphatidyltransferase